MHGRESLEAFNENFIVYKIINLSSFNSQCTLILVLYYTFMDRRRAGDMKWRFNVSITRTELFATKEKYRALTAVSTVTKERRSDREEALG